MFLKAAPKRMLLGQLGVLLLFVGQPLSLAAAETLVLTFRQSGSIPELDYRESLSPSPGGGWAALVEISEGSVENLKLDAAGATLEWRHRQSAEGTDILARREGSFVSITGTLKGKRVEKRLDFGDRPWYEYQELSLGLSPARAAPDLSFWTIKRDDLGAVVFNARKVGRESLPGVSGVVKKGGAGAGSTMALRYELTVAGIPALLFKSLCWLRESDGIYLRLEVPAIPGKPPTLVELVDEIHLQ